VKKITIDCVLYTVYIIRGLVDVKSGFKGIKIIIVVAIASSILISSAYFCYYTVAAADFLSPGLNFEAFDQEFLSAACGNELKILIPSSFLNGPCLINYHFALFCSFFSKIPSVDQDTLVLRC